MNRADLTDWIIHFVHRRNPANDPLEFNRDFSGDFELIEHPDGFDYDGNPLFKTSLNEEWEYALEPDALAFSVLRKILDNGYIRAGWSYRNHRPTIYGPKAAVCFTEMPLYGLIEYAQNRDAEYFIEDYGIAFLRTELFEAGARPVVYGLSTEHMESHKDDDYYGIGLRTLSAKCGIGLKEQYRYVTTNLGSGRRIDWTHEREWRWADLEDNFDEPGMPIFLENDHFTFSRIIVIVKEENEEAEIIDHLRGLYDAESDPYGRAYDINIIKNTSVLCLGKLKDLKKDIRSIRLEDLPLQSLPKIRKIKVSATVKARVAKAFKKANEIAYQISKESFDSYPLSKDGEKLGPCGFAKVVTYEPHSEITQALMELKIATAIDGAYHIYGINYVPTQLLEVREKAARAAAEYLTGQLGQAFYVHSRYD